ncbi:MAG: response regulator transcription factor [Armatimonadetes bacterium]|nr:response regulator transcription factor [Armatimonadota bacterium]
MAREALANASPLLGVGRDIQLTKRESEVLGLVVEGKSNKEVASELFCSKRTVDFHLARIYEKLQVNNRIQAVRRAATLGLISNVMTH